MSYRSGVFLLRRLSQLRSGLTHYATVRCINTNLFPKTLSNLRPGYSAVFLTPHRCFAAFPAHSIIKLPNLSPTMETGSVVSWSKQEGDELEEGELLAEIETDKATIGFEASDAGVLAKILAPAGTKDIPVGYPLCVVVEDAGLIGEFKGFTIEDAGGSPAAEAAPAAAAPPPPPAAAVAPPPVAAAAPPPPAAPAPVVAAPPPPPASQPGGGPLFISPLARRLAAEQGIDLAQLAASIGGTGMSGMIRSADLANYQPGAGAGPVSIPVAGPTLDIPLTNVRAVIAKRLTESKQTIPHFYLTTDINMDQVMKLRKAIVDSKMQSADGKPIKITVNDVIVKAIAVSCRRVPECNSAWQGTFVRQYQNVDVNVAVATPNGLFTPIVFGADTKGLVQINQEVKALAEKAKANKLQPQEFMGGTFTVSNLGMFGITSFSAIINPPQACLLAVGSSESRLIPDKNSPNGFNTATFMSATLCSDHRVVDGAVAARWMAEFKSALEAPASMLI